MAKKKRFYEGAYAGLKSRRSTEKSDSGMISEDRSAPSNLPQNVIYREYPRVDYDFYDLNDNIKGIDAQMKADVRGASRKKGQKYPEKY